MIIKPEYSCEKHDQHSIFSFYKMLNRLIAYHPVHARNRFRPKSGLPLAKLNMNVYIITVGSATPSINKG